MFTQSRRRRSTPIAVLLTIGIAFSPAHVIAADDPYTDNPYEAEVTFREGINLMKQGKYALACDRFAESYSLEPSGGTMLNLALCHRQIGKLATALVEAEVAFQIAFKENNSKRQTWSRKLIDVLKEKVARITIVIPPEAAAIKDLTVALDEVVLTPNKWGEGLPVEPGEHVIVASAPGYMPLQTKAWVDAHGANVIVALRPLEVERPTVRRDSSAAAPAVESGHPGPSRHSTPPSQPKAFVEAQALLSSGSSGAPPSTWGSQQAAGVVMGSAGLSMMVFGAGFGIHWYTETRESDLHCDGNSCNASGVEPRSETVWTGKAATGLLVTGSAALVGGLVLFTTGSPSGAKQASAVKYTSLGFGPAGASFSVRW